MAPFAVLPFLVGGWGARPDQALILAAVGLGAHATACSVNDLADLEADRENPARVRSPLVAGDLTHESGLLLACLSVFAFGLSLSLLGPVQPTLTAVGAFGVLILWGNVFQKKSKLVPPIAMDQLAGLSLAAPLALAPQLVGMSIRASHWLLLASYLLLIAVTNSTAGNLKDLAADKRTGLRTTAILAGVSIDPTGRVIAPTWYVRYSITAFAASVFLGILALGASQVGTLNRIVGAVLVLIVGIAGVRDISALVLGRRVVHPRGTERFIVFGVVSFICASTAVAGLAGAAFLLVVCALWVPLLTAITARLRHPRMLDVTP